MSKHSRRICRMVFKHLNVFQFIIFYLIWKFQFVSSWLQLHCLLELKYSSSYIWRSRSLHHDGAATVSLERHFCVTSEQTKFPIAWLKYLILSGREYAALKLNCFEMISAQSWDNPKWSQRIKISCTIQLRQFVRMHLTIADYYFIVVLLRFPFFALTFRSLVPLHSSMVASARSQLRFSSPATVRNSPCSTAQAPTMLQISHLKIHLVFGSSVKR